MAETEPSKRRVRWIVVAALVTVLALVAVAVLATSGLINARFQTISLEGSSGSSDSATRTVSIRFGVRNEAWTSITIVDAGRSSSFMRLLRIEGTRPPITLRPGDTADLEFVYEVTDCNNIPGDKWPIPLQVERPWGTQTVYVDPPLQDPDPFNGSVPDEDSGITWEWQGARASYVCEW
ncbi:hypothetical protein [Acrocarpospora catenulata]|uniref:hypothetical protein n=1 Tax=Acrocarpospora catenulata TaxID=2836182 RepID=UPI001BDA3E59|nr:hypothetical protein [Acrocarpospora catenulata]